ncbi:cysteine dioxygenase type 1, partial [Aphelenchoides avenae]
DLGIHLMENPSDSEGTVSLHLYIPPFASCKTFDKEVGETGTSPMTFHSVGGKLIYKAPI